VLERALLITGTVGVGKSTIGREVCRLLSDRQDPNAFIDLDKLSGCWPRPADDPFNTRLTAENFGCVTANFAAAGARSVVAAGVIETRTVLDFYERAIGQTMTVVRLIAPAPVIDARLRHRHRDDRNGLTWHLERARVLDSILDALPVAMRVVDSTSSPSAVAHVVLGEAGWATGSRA
jgi:adenylylsulfate kinase